MAKILTIETATKVCSVALFENDQLIAFKEINSDYSHAEKLAVFIDALLLENEMEATELSAVAVSKGPGSYTGLRIGVSLAKGLCFSLGIPLISIDTLKSMAWAANQENSKNDLLYCPMIDARRMEVYSAIFDSELRSIQPIKATIIDEHSFEEYLSERKVLFFGDGAEKCSETLTATTALFSSKFYPSSTNLGALAFDKFEKQQFEDVAYFEPFYLKEFIALKGKKLV
jgi:tRNA threonylcarbamoyladenosine biosynthesis protein TsaB